MLTVHVKTGTSMFNEETNEIIADTVPVVLEHSLLTLSEWEAKYKKPFLSDLPEHAKTEEETIDYIRMMVLDQSLPVAIFNKLIQHNLKEIQEYIGDENTATVIRDSKKGRKSSEIATSEVIYYWMFSNQIDKSCESWNLNRLITLIRVFAAKSEKPEKMSKSELAARNRALNAQRRAKYNTRG